MTGLEDVVSALVTLVVVVDPLGLAPIFVAVTEGLPASARRQVGARAALIAAAVLIGFALVGNWVLAKLGITLPAFRIAGGMLLFSIAFEMVFDFRGERQAKTAERALEEHVKHLAAFPLAIPLIAGPGAITATLLLGAQAAGQTLRLAVLVGIIVFVIALTAAVFLAAARVANVLGTTGNIVLSRLLGVVLAALAVQFVIDGVRALISA